jgi:hypothetical protein
LDFSSPRLFHNPGRRRFVLQQLSFRAISAQALRSVGDGKRSIQMLVHPHRAARQDRSPAHRFDLQVEVLKADGVIPSKEEDPCKALDLAQRIIEVCDVEKRKGPRWNCAKPGSA